MSETLPLADRRSSRYFSVALVAAIVIFAVDRAEVLGPLLVPLTELTTSTTMMALEALGIRAEREAFVIFQPAGFAYEIHYRCTGFLPVAIFVVATLAYPARLRQKFIGLGVGITMLFGANLLRLVDLFLIGISRPEYFEFMHEVLWQGIMGLAVFGLWLGWSKWVQCKAPREGGNRASISLRPWSR